MLYIEGTTIKLTRGDTAYLSVPIINKVTGNSYDIADGDILEFSVKKYTSDKIKLISKKIIGQNTFHILPEDTNQLPFGKCVYDVQLTTVFGDIYTVIEASTFELMEEVT